MGRRDVHENTFKTEIFLKAVSEKLYGKFSSKPRFGGALWGAKCIRDLIPRENIDTEARPLPPHTRAGGRRGRLVLGCVACLVNIARAGAVVDSIWYWLCGLFEFARAGAVVDWYSNWIVWPVWFCAGGRRHGGRLVLGCVACLMLRGRMPW